MYYQYYNNYYKPEAIIPGHLNQVNLAAIKIITKQMEESVCQIYGTHLKGTGFFCAIQNMKVWNPSLLYALMTNYHVLGEEDIRFNKKIKISLNNGKKYLEIIIDNSRKIFTSQIYDVTIIEMKQNDGIKSDSFLEIDKDIYKENFKEIFINKTIYLLHYPEGIEICQSLDKIKNIREDNFTIEHYCISTNGSSGGPLINLENFKVIGIHKGFLFTINVGTILRAPIEKFYEQFNNIIQINNNKETCNEITIQYSITNSERIRLFGVKFVENNKDLCRIIINNQEHYLGEYYITNNKYEFEKLEIKLKGIKNITNMSYMFYNCESLSSLPDISKWDTKKVTNMKYLFYNCEKLSTLPDISKWDTKNVNNMSYMFYNCELLSSLPDISKWDTENVINMSYMFSECKLLSSLPDISKWDTKNVTNMSEMFSFCESLSSLPDISKWDTKNVIDMSYMFHNCILLPSLPDISKWDIKNVTKMSYMFSECKSLSSLPDISKWDTKNVTKMSYMFSQLNHYHIYLIY